MAFDNIDAPDEFLGIGRFTTGGSNPRERVPHDKAHLIGDNLWDRRIKDGYQKKLDPDGEFGFNQNARWNGALVSNRGVDAAVLGTTAHGNHGDAINELHWNSNPDVNGRSFPQEIEREYDQKIRDLNDDLRDGIKTQTEFDAAVRDAQINAIKDHIAFTKTLEAGYLRQDILNAAGHSDIKHVAINSKDPQFDNAAEVMEYNEGIRDNYSKAELEQTDLYKQNRALVEEIFDPVLRADGPKTQADIDAADKRLNQGLVDNFADYARIFPEVDTPNSVRANVLATQRLVQADPDNTKAIIESITGEGKAEFEVLERQILNDLNSKTLFPDDKPKPQTLERYVDDVTRASIDNEGVERGVFEQERRLQAIYDAVNEVPEIRARIEANVTRTDTQTLLDEIGADQNSSSFAKAGATVSVLSAFVAGLAIYTQYRADTVEDPQPFDEYLARLGPGLIGSAGAITGILGGAIFLTAFVPGGSLIVLAGGIAGGYVAFKEFLTNYITAYGVGGIINDEGNRTDFEISEQSTGVRLAATTLTLFNLVENSAIGQIIVNVAEIFNNFVIKPYFEALVPSISAVDGYQVKRVDKDGGWLVGEDISYLIGDDKDNVLFHFGAGEVYGRGGNDWLISYSPDYIQKGDYLFESDRDKAKENETRAPDDQIEITGPKADRDYRLVLDGGKDDDYIIVLGGTGAITVGGEGRDFIFNTSAFGQIYGDTLDGLDSDGNPLDHTSSENADTFWFWPGTFIQDAQPNDRITLFGIPLVGGSNSIAGIPAGDGSAALDFFSFGTYYTSGTSGQLAITNLFARYLDIGPEGLEGVQIVENYDFGGFSDESYGRAAPGDLGLTFRIFLPLDRAIEGVVISLFNAVWGSLFTVLDAAEQLAKLNLFFFIPPQPSRKFCY